MESSDPVPSIGSPYMDYLPVLQEILHPLSYDFSKISTACK